MDQTSKTSGNGGMAGNGYGNGEWRTGNGRSRSWLFARRVLVVLIAAVALFVSRRLAYQLRFDFVVPQEYQIHVDRHWHWVILLQLSWLLLFRQFSGIYKYFSLPEIQDLAYAMIFSGASLYFVRYLEIGFSPPKGVILVQCMMGFLLLGAMRSAWRLIHERCLAHGQHAWQSPRRVAIIGAGDAGASLIRELFAHPNLGLAPVAFLDDASKKWGSSIHGVPVVGPPEQIQRQKEKLKFEEVIIAMPSCPAKRLGEVVTMLQEAHLEHVTVPSLDQLTSGRVRVSQLRPVRIDDLLGREAVDLHVDQICHVIKGRTLMVTGAGGSIGAEICRQVAEFQPSRLLLVDQSEVQMFPIEQELIKLGHGGTIVPVIADILDAPRMREIFQGFRPEVILHAAAHKHVGLMEIQPSEAIKNNVLGTMTLAELALEHRVKRFLLISTDKAVNPTSVMGASKRLAEVFLQAFAQECQHRTCFVAVRFGNVLGSSGSVVPIFERQIAEGGPVTVTHPEVVRFFMTIPEAVGLVLQGCAQGRGGEIFILDMGKPVRILDLARQMVKLSGLELGRDIEIKFTGLKPGEKLFEELHHLRADCVDTSHPRLKRLTNEPAVLQTVRCQLAALERELHCATPCELKAKLAQILPEYTPHLVRAPGTAGDGGKPAVAAEPSTPDYGIRITGSLATQY